MEFLIAYFATVALILMFMKGATRKGNLAEDPRYYD